MQRWEYRHEVYVTNDVKHISRWDDRRLDRSPLYHMQQLGQEGWELAAIDTIVRGDDRLTYYWLKRPIK